MFHVYAPEPEYNNVLTLPNPVLGDSESLGVEVQYKEAMDGTQRTYVRNSGTRTYKFEFENVGRGKMLEVREFLQLFAGEIVRVIWSDHPGVGGRCVLDQEATVLSHDSLTKTGGGPRTESGSFTLVYTRL